ncbi:AsnC family transcriptional regulator [Natronorarus salvus]|uniref:AsnC family transcriptional regulator n=1 Tax=Natronorarus salvus TaxID=3117733 RepID=UPI002F2676E0
MTDLDDVDLELLSLLIEDARRPYSDLAEHVGLSPPAVSDRISRLREAGVVRRFTVDLDRSTLENGTPVLVTLAVDSGRVGEIRDALVALEAVEHVFQTADGDLVVHANAPDRDVRTWLSASLGTEVDVEEVALLADVEWTPSVGGAEFSLTCVECENPVGPGGVSRRVDGDRKHFCCSSCERLYVDRYESLAQGVDS